MSQLTAGAGVPWARCTDPWTALFQRPLVARLAGWFLALLTLSPHSGDLVPALMFQQFPPFTFPPIAPTSNTLRPLCPEIQEPSMDGLADFTPYLMVNKAYLNCWCHHTEAGSCCPYCLGRETEAERGEGRMFTHH